MADQLWRSARRRERPSHESLWAQLRDAVLERDDYACIECGQIDELQVDHVIPLSEGGVEMAANLRTLCGPCNRQAYGLWRALGVDGVLRMRLPPEWRARAANRPEWASWLARNRRQGGVRMVEQLLRWVDDGPEPCDRCGRSVWRLDRWVAYWNPYAPGGVRFLCEACERARREELKQRPGAEHDANRPTASDSSA